MNVPFSEIVTAMMRYNAGDPKRIQHALKVYAYASLIGEREGLGEIPLAALKTAAALHDIGIRLCEAKYASAAGSYQELEGPPVARELLAPFSLPEEFVDRVCFLIGHHHTYSGVDGPDYRILLESDLLVNLYEDGASPRQARGAEQQFCTKTGREYFLFLFPED